MSKKKITVILFVCLLALYGYFNNIQISEFSNIQQATTAIIPTDVMSDNNLSNVTEKTVNQQTSNADITDDIDTFSCLSALAYDIEEIEALDEKINEQFRKIDESFSTEDAFNYAVFATPPKDKSRLDLLLAYQHSSPSNPIIGNGIITSCIQSSDDRCTNETIADAINTDRNNGATWLNAILFYAANKDDDKVISAITELEKTSFFNERFGEIALSYAQALEGIADTNFSLNAMSGIGKSASYYLPAYSPMTKWCKTDINNIGKANYCLSLGEQLETRSKTLISTMIGFALQETVYEAQQNNDARALVNIRSEEALKGSEAFQRVNLMIMLDERLTRSWLKNIDIYGEIGAQEILIQEAEALYEQNDNYLCSMVYNLLDSF
jgi:hypothetical protein